MFNFFVLLGKIYNMKFEEKTNTIIASIYQKFSKKNKTKRNFMQVVFRWKIAHNIENQC